MMTLICPRVALLPQRKVPSDHFSAWASYDRGMPSDQLNPALVRITPGENTFIGAGKLDGQGHFVVSLTPGHGSAAGPMRYTVDAGRTLSPVHVLSRAIKAYAPDVAFAGDGRFLVAWHEEQFPSLKTVVQPLRLPVAR